MSEPQPPTSGPPTPSSGGSRNLWTYLALGAGVIALAVVLFLVLRPDDSEPTAATTSEAQTTTEETTTEGTTTEETTTEETTTEETTTEETTTTNPEDELQRVNVVFRNGEVVGGVVRADVDEGARVRLTVRADVEDEVHLHGYDLFADVAPGQPGRITFTADQPGEFEAELEGLVIPVAELRVNP